MTHIRYGIKHNDKIHDATICGTPKGALALGRVYVMDYSKVHQERQGNNTRHWQDMLDSGEAELVRLELRECGLVALAGTKGE